MKCFVLKISFLALLMGAILPLPGIGQTPQPGDPLYVKTYKLDNGFTVYLNEDHNKPNVFGAVVVKGGGKRDPQNHLGIAHYFEHIMFKGTDQMGTSDYASEKVFLDSISFQYDQLGKADKKEIRDSIQLIINRLSLKAAEFAIPNEFDRIMNLMGGSGVNAFTSNDAIVYHNSFPSNQIERWLEVYRHRFEHPVYRLFQSELETVYEEKNMSMDNMMRVMFERFMGEFFKGHPYANPVLGGVEDLKNPSLSEMDRYFKTYYVANNMALILTGDFNTEQVIPMIKARFENLRTGDVPLFPEVNPVAFKGRTEINVKLTPVRIGVMGYRAVTEKDADAPALDVCSALLNNSAQTGFFDKLAVDNKIMGAFAFNYRQVELGSVMFYYIPKIVGQSFDKAEKLIFEALDKLKTGSFDDEFLAAIKLNLAIEAQRSLENPESRGYSLFNCFLENRKFTDVLDYPEKIKKITREDVMRVAKKYFGEDYLVMHSKMGFPKKQKLQKPPFLPVDPKNSERKSAYFQKIENMPTTPADPMFVTFSEASAPGKADVRFVDINDKVHLYHSLNPINDIFDLELSFGAGTDEIRELSHAASYLALLGTEEKDYDQFRKALQKVGASLSQYANDDYFVISVSGVDQYFPETLDLVREFMTKVKGDTKKIKRLAQDQKANLKMESKDPSTCGSALKEYAFFGSKSDYLDRPSIGEIKKFTSDQLLAAFKKAMGYEVNLHYSGKIPLAKVQEIIQAKLPLDKVVTKSNSPSYQIPQAVDKNTVYFCNDKSAIQSQINFAVDGTISDRHERAIGGAFNKYFGEDMSSIVFQEVREYRSLAYGTYATYRMPFYMDKKGYTQGWLSTQSDKTIEAIRLFHDLFTNIPKKPERMESVRTSLIQSINSEKPDFRYASSMVERWRKMGFKEDPRKYSLEIQKNVTFDDIMAFYNKAIAGKPILISVYGDEKRIDMAELAKLGTIIRVEKDKLFRK